MSSLAIGDTPEGALASLHQWVHQSERVFTVLGPVSADECAALIELAEQRGFDTASVRTTA
jgi:hypothetical protein